LTNPGSEVIGFDKVSNKAWANLKQSTIMDLNTQFPSDWPQIELIASPTGATAVGLLATFSRGNVTIKSASMDDAPIINPAWLADPRDKEIALAGFKYIRHLENSTSLQKVLLHGEEAPTFAVESDEDILMYCKEAIGSLFHSAASCKMGKASDPMAVVDADAKVFGVDRLRVVDISAFPFLVPGQPQSMVYALAEKIADKIISGR